MKASIIFSFCLLLIISCDQAVDKSEPTRLNTFEMDLNGKFWAPTDIDPCMSTFQCQIAKIDGNPYYIIKAYKDPQSIADLTSENFFQLRIMNVNEIGTYIINGKFESHFTSYARLTVNDADGKRVYENKENDTSFQVTISRFFPLYGSIDLKGIEGFFEGTLYNRDNPLDFIVIENGEFEFQKANFSNFNQCKE